MKRPKGRSSKSVGRQRELPTSSNVITQPLTKGLVVLVVAVVAASLLVRVYNLDGQGLDCEESFTVPASTGHHYVYFDAQSKFIPTQEAVSVQEYRNLVTHDPEKGLREVTDVISRNVHQPAYFYMMHYWIKLFGTSEWALRLPSVIFGTLAVGMLFLLGRELFNSFVGLVSALLLGMMPEQIFYSQEARMYPLLILLVVSSTYALLLTRRNRATAWPYVFYFVTSAIGVYTHYVYLFCFAFQALFIWLASPLGRARKRQWLITQGCVAVAFLPWLFVSWRQKQTSSQVLAWVHGELSSASILREVIARITLLIAVPDVPLGWLSVVAAYGLLLLGIMLLRSDRSALPLLGLWVCLPILGIIAMDAYLGTHAVNVTRYWLVVAPALYLLIGVGIQGITGEQKAPWSYALQLSLVTVLTLLLCTAAVASARGQLRRKPDEHKEMVRFIDDQVHGESRALVLTEKSRSLPLILGYYSKREIDILQFSGSLDNRRMQRLRGILKQRDDVWLLYSSSSNAQRTLQELEFRPTGVSNHFGHIFVSQYARRPKTAVADSP